MIIKCAIVDDEPLAVELLASYVPVLPKGRGTAGIAFL